MVLIYKFLRRDGTILLYCEGSTRETGWRRGVHAQKVACIPGGVVYFLKKCHIVLYSQGGSLYNTAACMLFCTIINHPAPPCYLVPKYYIAIRNYTQIPPSLILMVFVINFKVFWKLELYAWPHFFIKKMEIKIRTSKNQYQLTEFCSSYFFIQIFSKPKHLCNTCYKFRQ